MPMSMPMLSRENVCAAEPNTEKSPSRCPPFPRWNQQCLFTAITNYRPYLLDIEKNCWRKSRGDLAHIKLKPLQSYQRSNCCRCTLTTASFRRSNSRITKRRESSLGHSIPLPAQTKVEENPNTQNVDSLASPSDQASDSSYEQNPTSTLISQPDLNVDGEIAFHFSVSKDEDPHDACFSYEATTNEGVQPSSEGDNPPNPQEEEDNEDDDNSAEMLALSSLTDADTEHNANLAAVSDECQSLYQEYYERTHGNSVTEKESHTDAYWKWDQERHQWFHKDLETQSVVWFFG
ncbi:hypothetical protein F4678DRAFT_165027 [Xylaria arbuscula]|nr:hypothetical protein F4678DRAFT_165027 [Xylaria arbuscula]